MAEPGSNIRSSTRDFFSLPNDVGEKNFSPLSFQVLLAGLRIKLTSEINTWKSYLIVHVQGHYKNMGAHRQSGNGCHSKLRRRGRSLGLQRKGRQVAWRWKNRCLLCHVTMGHRQDFGLQVLPSSPYHT